MEAWYETAEMMEELKREERADVISSPGPAGSSVFGVSTFLLAVKLFWKCFLPYFLLISL